MNTSDSEYQQARMEKDYDRHLKLYEFYLDFGLKVNGFFYAIVGGILSFYYTKESASDRWVQALLLLLPIIIGLILGIIFLVGGRKWGIVKANMEKIRKSLRIEENPFVKYLSHLSYTFGILFIIVAILLACLMCYLIQKG